MSPQLPGRRPVPLRGLSSLDVVRLLAWKLRARWQRVADGADGYASLRRAGERWAEQWSAGAPAGAGPLRDWLLRPGAGSFWFPVADAARWAAEGCERADLEMADAAVRGEFDLLGSGPVALGVEPEWRRDLYTGREWPLEPAHRLRLARADGSDIRTVWELSRCYHFLPLARAYWSTGDARYRDAFVRHATSWLAQNPLGYGPNWACPMDVAIRAANWVVATVLFAGAEGISAGLWRALLGHLHSTGLYLERYLEWHPVYRGNHYVADAVGLVYLGTLFSREPDGDRWLRRGAEILAGEMERQVKPDGVSFEASLAYHRLVAELFTYGGELVRLNRPGLLPPAYDARLRAMYRFTAAYLPPGGEAPMLGDADDGRLHAVCAASLREPRRHRLGLDERLWPDEPPASAAFPEGGFFVMRDRDDHLVVRCGAVGLEGAGCHDHNDQLAYELVLGGRRVVADGGSYAYTRDLAARHAFRSTAAHGVVQLGGEEQNPIDAGRPWRVLEDRTRAQLEGWSATPEEQRFRGRHSGYAHRASGAVVTREIRQAPGSGVWEIVDEVSGEGEERVVWRLHLAACPVERGEDPAHFRLPGRPDVELRLRLPEGMRVELVESQASDRYGTRYPRPCLVATGTLPLPVRIEATFSRADRC